MSELRYCELGGAVVNGKRPISTDASVYKHPATGPLYGCNRLRCGTCGEWVRHGPPGLVGKGDLRPHREALFEEVDWSSSPLLEKQDPSYRLYACRCTVWMEVTVHPMVDPDPDVDSPSLPWACQGHPPPTLPATVGETTLSAETDFESLVDRILTGWSPYEPARDGDDGPATWLARLYSYLLGLPEAERLSAAVSRHLDEDDPKRFGRVLLFFTKFPRATGVDAVIRKVSRQIERIAVGYGLPEDNEPASGLALLASRLEARASPPDEIDRSALNAFKEALLLPVSELSNEVVGRTGADRVFAKLPGMTDSMAKMLAARTEKKRADLPLKVLSSLNLRRAFSEDDQLWLANHIVEIEKASPGRWKPIIEALVGLHRVDVRAYGHLALIAGTRLIESGEVSRDQIRDWVQAYSHSRDAWAPPLLKKLRRYSK